MTYNQFVQRIKNLRDIPLLAMRLVLAYGFFEPAKSKWSDIQNTSQWFESMNYPLPQVATYLVATFEAAGVVLLTLGLFTRIITIPLMIIMLVAIITVHISHGFAVINNGFEIPLYYLIMLSTLLTLGPGRLSMNTILLKNEWKKS